MLDHTWALWYTWILAKEYAVPQLQNTFRHCPFPVIIHLHVLRFLGMDDWHTASPLLYICVHAMLLRHDGHHHVWSVQQITGTSLQEIPAYSSPTVTGGFNTPEMLTWPWDPCHSGLPSVQYCKGVTESKHRVKLTCVLSRNSNLIKLYSAHMSSIPLHILHRNLRFLPEMQCQNWHSAVEEVL